MKKLLSLLLSLLLILTLFAGCGKNTPETPETPTAPQTETVEKADGYIEFTKADLDKANAQTYTKPKNVIVMISDGMGINDIALANKFSDFLFDFGLTFENLKNKGDMGTDSLSGLTDSAASATAMATGQKTENGFIGMKPDGTNLKNAPELAREKGKKVGIVTDDNIYGATPSGFTVHCASRDNTEEIVRLFIEFTPDVLIGDGYLKYQSSVQKFKRIGNVKEETLAKINVAANEKEWESKAKEDPNREKAFFGFLEADLRTNSYSLAHATQVALERLQNEKGFFLMVEGAACDKAGHNKNAAQKPVGVTNFDKAVAVAVKYCTENPDTLLIITSDHETGGVTLPQGEYTLSKDIFTTDYHTNANVGVFALGYGAEYFNGKTIDNADLGKFIHAAIKGEEYK
ncbi:MAG: alkaline phosphatase [Clostridia bacterium]|nr:alkaline phosphatase [Clostridia bacterium]